MKDKTKSTIEKPSPQPEEKTVVVAPKRKAPEPLALATTEMAKPSIITPKRPRTSPSSTSPSTAHPLAVPSPIDSATPLSFVSSALTPPTPQTPSKPSTAATAKLSARKQRTIHDPLNISIYGLRQQGLDWNDIAEKTNARCSLVGTDAELSGMACYSRFFRNGPLIAREKGEEFKKEWYLHMRGPVAVAGGDGEGEGEDDVDENSKGGDKEEAGTETAVLKAVEKMRAEFWENVTAVVNESLGGKTLTVEEVKAVHDGARDRGN